MRIVANKAMSYGVYPVRSMCTWARVSRSGYCEWKDRPASVTPTWRVELAVVIADLFTDSDETYGYRRIHAALSRAGRHVDPQTVRSIMAELGLVAARPGRRGPRTTIASDAAAIPDLVPQPRQGRP